MSQPAWDILFQEAKTRWLKPPEVQYILQNHENHQLQPEPPQKPTSGSLFLFNKRVTKFFRKDGHNWRKKKDGRAVGEAHEKLKVNNVEALNCYYAHGEQNLNFQRRSYWMLDPAYGHIVLVHYRDISEGKFTPGSAAQLLPSISTPSPTSYTKQNHCATENCCTTQNQDSSYLLSDSHGLDHNSSRLSFIKSSTETICQNDGLATTSELCARNDEVSQFPISLENQLILNEDNEILSDYDLEQLLKDLTYEEKFFMNGSSANLLSGSGFVENSQGYDGHARIQLHANDLVHHRDTGNAGSYHQSFPQKQADEPISWDEILEVQKNFPPLREPAEEQAYYCWPNFNENDDKDTSTLLPQEVDSVNFAEYPSIMESCVTNPESCEILYGKDQLGITTKADSSLTLSRQQRFTIQEISPQWGYATETTKVIIIGSFLCEPSESAWACMFGDTEVTVEIIKEGVLCSQAPPHLPGKVTFCITAGNRESCSEIREFEYRSKSEGCTRCNSQTKVAKSPKELLLLVKFAQLLLPTSFHNENSIEAGVNLLRNLKTDDDSWGAMETLLSGDGTSSGTLDWLVQQLLKDKLQQWLSSKSQEIPNQPNCTLSKKEQGIIHMISGLGFVWALSPILNHGVNINFRDINGWTALHWAARFGREKMVAALIASGAWAGAFTDPTSQYRIGETPASIAAKNGYKGIAGYLSELALTSHLSSLTLEESELSKASARIEAEKKVHSITKGSFASNIDQVSLAAVRNASEAAIRIQTFFRAYSLKKRQQKEAAASANSIDEYGVGVGAIQALSSFSKLAFPNARSCYSAALSIQKKQRGRKCRREFLALRQKVVKIQAHVRGYQVRKYHKLICWAVGILEKIVLRWKRRGIGLRGFRNKMEPIHESEDEDILKVFRELKVKGAIDDAVSRVLSMVESPEARQQYHRMLESYREAKAELVGGSETITTKLSG